MANLFDTAVSHPYITVYNSKAVLKKVNRRPDSKLVRPYRAFARVLSLLLLGFIVYGTTVEAAHKHGKLVRGSDAPGTRSVSYHGADPTLSTDLSGCTDCLICQLQQHFSTALISSPPSIGQSASNSLISRLALVSVRSQTTATSSGRAPPYAS